MKVSEEATETYIEQLLAAIPPMTAPVERLILCSDGTVQTNLSILFRVPVTVEVLSQEQILQAEEAIIRKVRLVAQYSPQQQITACIANSIIPLNANSREFIDAINEKKLGIGQILKAMGYRYERHVSGIYANEYEISRDYTIIGENLYLTINEVFSRNMLTRAGEII